MAWFAQASDSQCLEVIKTRAVHKSIRRNIPKMKCGEDRLKPAWMTRKIKKNIKKKYNLYNKFLNSNKSHDYQKHLLQLVLKMNATK